MMTPLHCKFGRIFQKWHMTVITSSGIQLSVESSRTITLVLILVLRRFEIG